MQRTEIRGFVDRASDFWGSKIRCRNYTGSVDWPQLLGGQKSGEKL